MNRRALTIALVTLSAGLLACDEDTVTGPGFVCDITNPVKDVFAPSSRSVLVHSPALPTDTVQVRAIATNRFGNPRTDVDFEFSSSDETIAVVDNTGLVTALRPGTVRITASACGKSVTTEVTVVANVSRVTVTPAPDTVVAGDTAMVTAAAFGPNNARVPNVKFTFGTSNPAVTVIQTSDSTANVVSSTIFSGTVTISATGEGAVGTGAVLILARVFLPGNIVTNGLDAGDDMVCGLISTGQLFCWGLNDSGQLGTQTDSTCFSSTQTTEIVADTVATTARPCTLIPLRVAPELAFPTISSGDATSCGISFAGRAYCWGAGGDGQIGNGTSGGASEPTLVTAALAFTSISVGGGHACGLVPGGLAYCWGSDSSGELGDARRVNSTTPIPVSGGESIAAFASISAGFRHTCAVAPDGTGVCWGNNAFGQLGDGTTTSSDTPAAVAGGLRFQSISSGGDHTCGITTSGAGVCWGSNARGQLGNGIVGGMSAVPIAVAGGLTFSRISASSGSQFKLEMGGHTCGLTTAGAVLCWGENRDLQLGTGVFSGSDVATGSPTPTHNGERPGAVNFVSVTTGLRHSCAVGSDGAAYCWGSNVFGALGNTLQAAYRGRPQRVATPR